MDWNNEKSFLFIKNGSYVSSATTILYGPLTGSSGESSSSSSVSSLFIPPNSGRLKAVNIFTESNAGDIIVTLFENGGAGVLATKTVSSTVAGQVYPVDFTMDLDSGNPRFSGVESVVIGFDVATDPGTVRYTVEFEIDL